MVLLKNQGDFQTVAILYDQNLRYKLDYKLCRSVKFVEVEFANRSLKFGSVSEIIDAEYVG